MRDMNQVVSTRIRVGGASIVLSIVALGAPAMGGEIYQYVESDGTIAFTNVPTDHRYQKIASESRTTTHKTRPPRSSFADYTGTKTGDSLLSDSSHSRPTPSPFSWLAYQEGRHVEEAIRRHAGLQQLNPALVRAVIKAESDFDPWAVSRTGAVGLMQLMPQTALEVGVANPYDVEANIGGGTKYLRGLLDRFDGNLLLALAAYNAGPNSVERNRGIPPIQETREYVSKVLRFYRAFLKGTPSIRSSGPGTIPNAAGSPLLVFSAPGAP